MVLRRSISAVDVKTAVQQIIPYLVNTSNDAPKVICIDGWHGLGISAVLRARAEHPPPSLLEKFDKIIHIDCSMWNSRRALQRVITDVLNLTQHVAADFDKQDEEDDFNGVDQSSRAEIGSVARVVTRSLVQYRCLVVFHSGSGNWIDLTSCGIPDPKIFDTKVLWTFRGRFRLSDYVWEKGAASDLYLSPSDEGVNWNALLVEEAREIALYTRKLGLGVTPETATDCCLYLLSLSCHNYGYSYKWKTHASSYLVCDGIVEGGQDQDNRAWEIAHALLQQTRLKDVYASETLSALASRFDITRSFFRHGTLHSDGFHHKADQLRVLYLSRCTFSFSSPPFHCCHNLRFLGLDTCKDEQHQLGEEEKRTAGAQAVEVFQRLWVLDVCWTDWELDFPLETEQVASDIIREVRINNGRIWRRNLAWRRLPNLRKLRVVEPTSSWETGRQDEFMDMVKLELLDLSVNRTIKVLPSLSGATRLKTLVLNGCLELEQIGPHGLPPSLESFSLGIRYTVGEAKISRISLAGCTRLLDFTLSGWFPNLEELDLSHTSVKMLDLRNMYPLRYDLIAVREVELNHLRLLPRSMDIKGQYRTRSGCYLQRVFLMGCEELRSIRWHDMENRLRLENDLRLLCIDTRAGGMARKPSPCDSYQGEGQFIAVADMRFFQSVEFLWRHDTRCTPKLNLCVSSTSKDGGSSCRDENMGCPYSTAQLAAGSPLPKPLSYHDVSIEQMATSKMVDDSSNATRFETLDYHMEIGEGIRDVPEEVSTKGKTAICGVMGEVQSLHVHDSSYITAVAPEHIFINEFELVLSSLMMNSLKWCRVVRCSKLDTVFPTYYGCSCFSSLETFWAAHLLMARSIWSRPGVGMSAMGAQSLPSFTQLRAIHLHSCPRLRYVLRLLSNYKVSMVLETLHILCCGDLRHVFPVEQEFQDEIAASHETQGMLAFPKLKDIYLHDLSSLQQICEAKMFAPNLETIYIRGCWSLRRLPATDSRRRQDGRPVAVDCEKECWDKLEWDGMEYGHHPVRT